jgi:tetratricopeptide (TPR) repeat protein
MRDDGEPAGGAGQRDHSLVSTESPGGLLIRARQAFQDVTADPDRFHDAAEALVGEARLARQPDALALALRALAWADKARLDDQSAIRLLDEACRVARRHHLDRTLADLLMSRAAVRQELGRLMAARADLRAAAGLVTGPQTAELDFHRAVLLHNGGRLPAAAEIYHRLLADPRVGSWRKAVCATNLALIEAEQGRYGPALRRLDQIPGAAVIGPELFASVTENRAWVTVQSGRFAEGLRIFEEAARAFRAARLPLGEHYIEYADTLMELRLLPEATAAARRAVTELSAAGVPLMAADAQLRVARLALLAGEHAEAVTAAAAAAAAFRRQTRATWRARAVIVAAEARLRSGAATDTDLRRSRAAAQLLARTGTTSAAVQGFLVTGRLASSLGLRRQAITALTTARLLARRTSVLVRLRGHVASALAAGLRGRDREALAYCRRGLADLSSHRDRLPSVELRALASGHGAELGRIGLDVVVRDGSPARVLNWMERSRAAALLAVEPPAFAEISADLASLRAVHARLRGNGGQGAAPAVAAARRAGQLPAEQAAIEQRIRQATWRGGPAAGPSAAPVTAAALHERLTGRVLVAYGALHDDLVAVIMGPRRRRMAALGSLRLARQQLRALLFALRQLAQPRPPAQHAAARMSADLRIRRLAELLVAPLAVSPDAELVVVPLPGLDGTPWAALHGGPVSLAPSATFWARTADAADSRPARRSQAVTLVAGPELPGAIEEVESLARLHAAARRITPPASTADAVADALADADLAHLACHGMLRSDNPMFSSLMLSDGPMTVQELYSRGLAPHRLVLASCESGTQASYAGDEVLGFVGALLARGTAGVLASAAVVPDVPAVDLMTSVHRHLAGGSTLARALHAARAAQDTDDPGSFVNWCTFNAHGAA